MEPRFKENSKLTEEISTKRQKGDCGGYLKSELRAIRFLYCVTEICKSSSKRLGKASIDN